MIASAFILALGLTIDFEPLARQDLRAANAYGGNGYDVVLSGIQPGRFAVDCDGLARRRLIEQEAKSRVAQQVLVNAPLDREQH